MAGVPRVGPAAGSGGACSGFVPGRAAWVCFTSGSSGRPKGVEVLWRGVPGLVEAQRAAFAVRAGDRVCWALSPGFDATFSDVLVALDAGAFPICAPPGLLAQPEALVAWLAQTGVACADLPPALLPHIRPESLPPTLRTVVVGGEVASAEALRAWARVVRVVAVYGPTEATVCTHLAVVDPDTWRPAALGHPIDGVVDAVVDGGQRADSGVLWLSGSALARGYLDELATAERFVDADLGDGLRRWYRTGDRVERQDGHLLFRGRLDRVTKVRGQLVALAEVEAALLALPGVTAAAVVKVDGRLHAMVAGDGSAGLVLRDAVAERLPDWMVPTMVVVRPDLPRMANEKVDHVAVARLLRTSHRTTAVGVAGQVAAAWAQVLGRPVLPHTDLSAAGRDSLAVLEVHRQLDALGLSRPLGLLAHARTPADMVADRPITFSLSALADRARTLQVVPGACVKVTGDRVFWLGSTGFVGAMALVRFLADPLAPPVTALVRGRSEAHARQRLEAVLSALPGRPSVPPRARLDVVCGDITQDRLGLSPTVWQQVVDRTALVVDLAGQPSLSASLDHLWDTHVAPIPTLAHLARAAGDVAVLHAGTLSVFVERWPRRAQVVVDGARLPRAGALSGAYAASKWAAEHTWRRLAPGPLAVVRLGLVVGDRRTGRPAPGSQLVGLVRQLAASGCPEGVAPTAAVNLTPRDAVADLIVHQARTLLSQGGSSTVHGVQPRNATVDELLQAIARVGRPSPAVSPFRSTTADPTATALLSTGVTFASTLVARIDGPAWETWLDRLVAAALTDSSVAPSAQTGHTRGAR